MVAKIVESLICLGFLSLSVIALQVNQHSQRERCLPVIWRGISPTVDVNVGTPAQKFQLVLDTGSSELVVSSCKCNTCKAEACYEPSKSSSYVADPNQSVYEITYGSGPITGIVSTDVVTVGDASATMNHGVFEVQSMSFKFDTSNLEGIFGVGIPAQSTAQNGDMFLVAAKIQEFSLCFTDDSHGGQFNLNSAASTQFLSSVGKEHWGLGMDGVAVGDKNVKLTICSPSTMTPEQETPCGAIPDSGTTMITGPKAGIAMLKASICGAWPRCNNISNSDAAKVFNFDMLLYDCGSWLGDKTIMDEGLPTVYFDLTGAKGEKTTVEFTPWAYIEEVSGARAAAAASALSRSRGKPKKQCASMFDGYEYKTIKNGDVWILGTSLFFAYNVAYRPQESPPSIGFVNEACGNCDASRTLQRDREEAKVMRVSQEMPRMPRFNTSLPL